MRKINILKSQEENFKKYRFLLRELVRKNIKLQYRNSVLGIFWTFLQPLLTMIILALVFNNIFGRSSAAVVNYSVYLLTGRLLFDFFTQSTKKAMRSIRGNSSIIKKVYVPKYIYPLSNVLSTFVTFLISLIVLVVVIVFFNVLQKDPVDVTWRVVYSIVPIIILFVLSLGVGMILATISVFFRDVENLYDVFTVLLFYVTPIVYNMDALKFAEDSIALKVFKLNPLYGIIGMFRAAILWGNDFVHHWDMRLMYYSIGFAIVSVIIGFLMFYRNQDKFILHI